MPRMHSGGVVSPRHPSATTLHHHLHSPSPPPPSPSPPPVLPSPTTCSQLLKDVEPDGILEGDDDAWRWGDIKMRCPAAGCGAEISAKLYQRLGLDAHAQMLRALFQTKVNRYHLVPVNPKGPSWGYLRELLCAPASSPIPQALTAARAH